MKWLALTIALLGACVALVGGIYLRDRNPSGYLPPEGTVARHDALAIADTLSRTCPESCVVKLLGHPQTDHWTERIEVPTATECFDIDVRAFATDEEHGISGVRKVACHRPGPTEQG